MDELGLSYWNSFKANKNKQIGKVKKWVWVCTELVINMIILKYQIFHLITICILDDSKGEICENKIK